VACSGFLTVADIKGGAGATPHRRIENSSISL